MDINKVSDTIYDYLATKAERVYTKVPQSPVFPYVYFRIDTITDTWPSVDAYLYIDVFEDANASIRAIRMLADTLQSELEQKVIITDGLNMRFSLEQRQYVPSEDLIDAQMIDLRYVLRIYFD